MEVNLKKYQQCDSSRFLQEPLLSLFGYIGQSEHTESVLDGSFVSPPTTDQYSALLLQHMQRPPSMSLVNDLPDRISTHEHVSN
jgi:hypothetical protein